MKIAREEERELEENEGQIEKKKRKGSLIKEAKIQG